MILTTKSVTPQTNRERWFLFLKFILLVVLILEQILFPGLKKSLGINPIYLNALLFYVTGNLIIDFARIIIISIYRRRPTEKTQPNFVLGINQIANIISYILLLLAIFILFKLKVVEVLTSLTIVAAAIAITFKDFVVNFIYGLLIMFTDKISLGDRLEIQNRKGQIIDITLMHLYMLTDDSELVYIPNATAMNTDVVNFTKRAVNRINFDFVLEYKYLKNIPALEAFLKKALVPYTSYIEEDSYNLKTAQIHKDSADMRYQYTMLQLNRDMEIKIRRVIARKVLEFVNQE